MQKTLRRWRSVSSCRQSVDSLSATMGTSSEVPIVEGLHAKGGFPSPLCISPMRIDSLLRRFVYSLKRSADGGSFH